MEMFTAALGLSVVATSAFGAGHCPMPMVDAADQSVEVLLTNS